MLSNNCIIDNNTPCRGSIQDSVIIQQGFPDLRTIRPRDIRLNINAPICRCLCQELVSGYVNFTSVLIDIFGTFPYSMFTSIIQPPTYYTLSPSIGVCDKPTFEGFDNCFSINVIPDPLPAFDLPDINLIASSSFTSYDTIRHDIESNTDVGFYVSFEIYANNDFTQLIFIITAFIVTSCRRFFINYSAFVNAKEDYEVLKGLWIGDYAYQEHHDTHIIKNTKVIDLI
jgi:hypothetical protein